MPAGRVASDLSFYLPLFLWEIGHGTFSSIPKCLIVITHFTLFTNVVIGDTVLFITKGGSVLKMISVLSRRGGGWGGFFSLLISFLPPTHLSADQIAMEWELTPRDLTVLGAAGQGIIGHA